RERRRCRYALVTASGPTATGERHGYPEESPHRHSAMQRVDAGTAMASWLDSPWTRCLLSALSTAGNPPSPPCCWRRASSGRPLRRRTDPPPSDVWTGEGDPAILARAGYVGHGSGKSTLSFHFACWPAEREYSVGFFDADAQRSSSR